MSGQQTSRWPDPLSSHPESSQTSPAACDAYSTPKQVVIIGGGIAGMAAAEAILRAAGDRCTVRLLEAKRMTGGRAGSFIDPATGRAVDYCQHVAMGCCTNLRQLLVRCGIDDLFKTYRELTFLHPDCLPSRFAPSVLLPPPLHLLPALGSLNFLPSGLQREIRRGVWKLMRTRTDTLSGVTASQWLSDNNQTTQAIERFWDVILVSALGEQTDHVAMSAARKVLIDGFAAARGASDLLVPQRPLSDIFGRILPDVIKKLGADVSTGTAVEQICGGENHNAMIQLRSGETIQADHVIAAVPWHVIGRLLSDSSVKSAIPQLAAIEAMPASPITGVHLWFDREITQLPHAVMVGTKAQWLFRDDARGGDTGADGHRGRQGCYYQVVISGSHEVRSGKREALIDDLLQELCEAFPAARDAKLLHSRIVTDPQSVFSIRPSVEPVRPTQATALPWLHLAGDWTRTGWPATMEGAVISGRLAAASMLGQEGVAKADIDPGLQRRWLARSLIAG